MKFRDRTAFLASDVPTQQPEKLIHIYNTMRNVSRNVSTVVGVALGQEAKVNDVYVSYRTMNQRSSIIGTVQHKVAKEADDVLVLTLFILNTDE